MATGLEVSWYFSMVQNRHSQLCYLRFLLAAISDRFEPARK